MAWEDPEPEEESGPLAVARALSGSDEADVPQQMPEPNGAVQPVAGGGDPQSTGAEDDGTAQSMLQPDEITPPEQQGPYQEPQVEVQPDDELTQLMDVPEDDESGGEPNLKAPTLPKTPQYEDNTALLMQKAHDQVDPSKYKPSVGRRILAGVAGFAGGFGHNPNANDIGASIRNAPLTHARAAAQPTLDADDAALAAMAGRNAQARQVYADQNTQYGNEERDLRNQAYVQNQNGQAANRNAQAEARKNAIVSFTPDDGSKRDSVGTGKTADGRILKGVPAPQWYGAQWDRDPVNKANAEAAAGLTRLKAMKAAGVPLTPEQQAIVASGGKITPAVRTTVSIAENPDGSARTPAGRGKTAAGGMNPSLQAKVLGDKNKAMQKAQSDLSSGVISKEEALSAMQDAQDNFEQTIEAATGQKQPHLTLGNDFQWKSDSGQPAQPAGAPPGGAPAQQAPPAAAPSGLKVSLAQARQLPINRGKTDDQIKADIQAHGHQVVP